jgi:hypothetical protein
VPEDDCGCDRRCDRINLPKGNKIAGPVIGQEREIIPLIADVGMAQKANKIVKRKVCVVEGNCAATWLQDKSIRKRNKIE